MLRCTRPLARGLSRFHARGFASRLDDLKAGKAKEIAALSELIQMQKFVEKLEAGMCELPKGSMHTMESVGMSREDLITALDAGMATFAIHCESRVASMLGTHPSSPPYTKSQPAVFADR